ncbi:MAG: MerR family transcriptional regulator [Lachnospiraceae bacterium]|nr:MerR family transcriptional regulator [Lachnospiraceae bacterium]
MRTVKEISDLTGISVRTLHYYDEIGLLAPTEKSDAGYRLYDDKALETLQQILFFREFDIPLKEIKAVIENPALDRNHILLMQRKMLTMKKERMERLIASIDNILKGEKKMDFEVFSKTELEGMADDMIANMNEAQKGALIEKFGSVEQWRKEFLKKASSEEAQRSFEIVVGWYGSKEKTLEAMKEDREPGNSELFTAYQKRFKIVMEKAAAKKGSDVNSFEVKELVGEYDFLSKQMYRMDDVTEMMLEYARSCREKPEIVKMLDDVYGEGFAEFFGRALEAFYMRK